MSQVESPSQELETLLIDSTGNLNAFFEQILSYCEPESRHGMLWFMPGVRLYFAFNDALDTVVTYPEGEEYVQTTDFFAQGINIGLPDDGKSKSGEVAFILGADGSAGTEVYVFPKVTDIQSMELCVKPAHGDSEVFGSTEETAEVIFDGEDFVNGFKSFTQELEKLKPYCRYFADGSAFDLSEDYELIVGFIHPVTIKIESEEGSSFKEERMVTEMAAVAGQIHWAHELFGHDLDSVMIMCFQTSTDSFDNLGNVTVSPDQIKSLKLVRRQVSAR